MTLLTTVVALTGVRWLVWTVASKVALSTAAKDKVSKQSRNESGSDLLATAAVGSTETIVMLGDVLRSEVGREVVVLGVHLEAAAVHRRATRFVRLPGSVA